MSSKEGSSFVCSSFLLSSALLGSTFPSSFFSSSFPLFSSVFQYLSVFRLINLFQEGDLN
jgi:hypothetical protein